MCLDVKNLQSNILRLITSNSTCFISTSKLTPWSFTTPSTLCCEGVLIFALPPRLTTYPYPVCPPIHASIQGYLCRWSYLHCGPPFQAQVKATQVARLYSIAALQVRTHATPDGHTPTPQYDSRHTRPPLGSMMYHRLFPRSCLSQYSSNNH
jgi:hypothetical protein